MKVLLVGVGGVGEAIAAIAKPRAWVEQIVLADYNLERAKEVQKKLGMKSDFPLSSLMPASRKTSKHWQEIQCRPDHERGGSGLQQADLRCRL
ncbi:MAG: hypothetical protein MZV70_21410 [Desulfobacterales bacterium]|nr:hypothetical protein [Desulfobacterales bacterium]